MPNVIEVHAKVLSGGQPDGGQAFARLATLGVKTIISVDGMKPDVAAARKYGLRYVHLPHGYDGVPADRGMELAKAVRDLPGRVYIHCHHGKHRSPAAAAVACVGAGLMAPGLAAPLLEIAGTGTQYIGLLESAKRSQRFDAAALDRLQIEYREFVPLPPLAKAMVEIDRHAERARLLDRRGWKPPEGDAKPGRHTVLLLREQYRELLRDPAVASKPREFAKLLTAGEAELAKLEGFLIPEGPTDVRKATTLWRNVQRNCTVCHAKFRDVPQPAGPP